MAARGSIREFREIAVPAVCVFNSRLSLASSFRVALRSPPVKLSRIMSTTISGEHSAVSAPLAPAKSAAPSRALVLTAYATVYVVWGSTYLAIRYAVETIPPFVMAGARFILAGMILILWSKWRDGARATASNWRAAAIAGALLLAFGNGAVVWAEQRVPSGLTALLVSAVPLWMVLAEWLRPGGKRPTLGVAIGIAVGRRGSSC